MTPCNRKERKKNEKCNIIILNDPCRIEAVVCVIILDSWQLLKVVILTFLLVFQHVYFCQSFNCWR